MRNDAGLERARVSIYAEAKQRRAERNERVHKFNLVDRVTPRPGHSVFRTRITQPESAAQLGAARTIP